MHINSRQDDSGELVESILREAWSKLLKIRDKIEFFDIIVPSQLLCWYEDMVITQIETLRIKDKEALDRKKLATAIAYRYSIMDTVGMDYFLKVVGDEKHMRVIDDFTEKIREKFRSEMAMKRLYR